VVSNFNYEFHRYSKERRNLFILITGMHRSGTSFLARALNLRGVYLGKNEDLVSDQWRPLSDNLTGHWENKKIYDLSEKTLSDSRGKWDTIPKKIVINKKIGNELKKFTNELIKNSTLASGIKDPRILLCLEAWLKFLPKNFVIIGIFRHPLKVCQSLKKRNNFSYEKSLHLWKHYNERLLSYLEKYNGFLIDFDWPQKKIFKQIDFISKQLGLAKNIDLSNWYSKDLMKSDQTYQKNYNLDNESQILYKKLKTRAEQNKKLRLKIKPISKDESQTFEKLFQEIQNQGNYFKTLNDKNLKKIYQSNNLITKLSKDLKDKETEIIHSKDYIAKLTKELQDKETEISQSTGTIPNITKELEEKENEISKGKDYIAKLTRDLQDKETEISQSKNSIEKLTQDLKDKETELTRSKDHISRITKDLHDKETEISQSKNSIEKLTQDLKDKETELTRSKDYVSKFTKDFHDKEAGISQSKNSIEKLTQDLKDKETELTRSKDYISKLTNDLHDKEAELTKSKEFTSKLDGDLSMKNDQIKNLENQLKELEKNLKIIQEKTPKYYSSRL